MSAHFILRYRGQAVKLTFQAGKSIFEVVADEDATPFTSVADAWLAAYQHGINPDSCEVASSHGELKGVAV